MNEFLQSLRNNKNKPYNRSRRQYDGNQYNPQEKRSGNDRRQRPHRQFTDYDKRGSGAQDDDLKALKPLLETLVANQQKRVAVDERRAAAEERKADALEGIVVYLKHLVGPDAPDLAPSALPVEAKKEIQGVVETMVEEPVETPVEEAGASAPVENAPEASFYSEEAEFAPAEPVETVEDDSMTVEEYLMMTAGGGKMEEEEELTEEAPETAEKLVLEAEPAKKSQPKVKAAAPEKEAATPEEDVERVDIMGIIREMRGEGKTYGQIAQYLADRNLPTFSGRGKWHAQTVHRLCQKR